ncbi:hypothetical protein Tco_0264643 [Tanacetum coccineum]
MMKTYFEFPRPPEIVNRETYQYLNDLEEEYQSRALLAKSKRFFKKGTQWFSSAKSTDQTECHKCGKKVKAKLALLSSSASVSKAVTIKNKDLIAEAYEWDEEKVSSDGNEMVEVKVLMALAEENDAISKEGARNGEWVKMSMRKCIGEQISSQKKRILGVDQLTVDPSNSVQKDLVFVKSSADETKVSIPSVKRPKLSEAEGFIFPNHNIGSILPTESQRNTTYPSVAVTDSLATKYDSADECSVCSTHLPPQKKLDGVEPISGSKTIKSILRLKSTFKAKTLKGVKINKPSSAPAKGNKSSSASKVNSAPAGKLKSMKIKDDPPLAIIFIKISCPKTIKMLLSPLHTLITSLEREINTRNPQQAFKRCEACGSSTHTTTDQYDTEWFKRGEALQAKMCHIKKPIWYLDSGCSRHMTGVKSYLHKYEEQPGPKVVFRDDSTCVTKGYGSIKCNGIVFTKVAFVNGLKYNLISISQLYDAKYIVQFDEKRGTIFNSNKEIVMIALRVRDVYVLDMTSSAQESCFFAKDFENLNSLWHKKLRFNSSALALKAATVKNKGLIAKAYEWDEEEVLLDDNEIVEVKVLMILKENKNLRTELKELTTITKTWLNNSNKVNQCISEQIPSQKKRIIGVDQLNKDPFSSWQKDLVFVKSSANDTKVSIPGVERSWLSEAKGFILPNYDTGRILLAESQRNTTDPPLAVTDSSATNYDLSDESSVCSTLLPPLKKLDGVEPIFGPNTIKSILRSKSTFKAETLKGVIINEPSSAPAKGNKSSSASKVNSALAGKLKSVKIKDDHPLAIVMKELNNLKLLISKTQSSYSRNNHP